jgi:hypothetical protein
MHNHVLSTFTKISKLVYTNNELDVFCHDRMDSRPVVNSEITRLRLLNAVNVKLEHSCKFRPESLANSVVIKIEYRDFIPLLHNSSELVVKLNTEQHCEYVKATTGACTSSCCRSSCSLYSSKSWLACWWMIVLSEPLNILIYNSAEDLDEDRGHLRHR